MILRYLISVIVLCVVVAVAPLSVRADTDAPTSVDLYERGMQFFEAAQYAEAHKAFWDLNLVPADLSPEQRNTMWRTMQKIDRQLNPIEDPEQLLTQAQKAQRAGQLAQADAHYRQVIASDKSTDKQKSLAKTRLADIERQLEPKIAALRRQIDAARADIKADRLDDAAAKLKAVKESSVSLGWYDQRSVGQLLARVDERREQRLALANDPIKDDTAVPGADAQENDEAAAALDTALDEQEQVKTTDQPQPYTSADEPKGKSSSDDQLREAMKLYAQEHMAHGREAEQRGEFHLAANHYAKAVDLDPDNVQAATALQAAREKAQTKSAPSGPLRRDQVNRELRRQEAVSEHKQLMNRAGDLREQKRFKEALELVNQAKAVLDRNKNVIPPAQYNRLRHEAERIDAEIDQERRIAEAEAKVRTEDEAKEQAIEQRIQAELEKYRVTQELLTVAIDLLTEQKFEEALAKLHQAEFRDPNNSAVQALIQSTEISKAIADSKAFRKERRRAIVEQSRANEDATYPQPEILVYPPDWPQITKARLASIGQGGVDDKINRAVELKLQRPIQEIDFDTQALGFAIDFVRQTTDTNIYVNWNALREAGIDEDTTVTLRLNGVSADHALTLMLRQVSTELDPITYSIRQGIVEISTRQDLTTSTVTRTYDIQDLLIQVPRFANAPQFDLNAALENTNSGSSGTGTSGGGTSGGGGGSGGSGQGGLFEDDDTDDEEDQPTRTERIDNISDLIRNTVGRPDEWVLLGGDVSSLTELNGTLIVKTTTDNHKEVITLLNQLREARAIQISVEARFLLVDQNFLEEVGADVDIVISNIGSKWGDVVISQDSFGVTAAPSTGLPGGFLSAGGVATGDVTGGAGSGRSLDLSVSYIDDLQVSLLVRATQQHRRSISLSAPRLTLMNGQRAFLYVARQISFISDVEPISDGVGFDPTLSVLNEGVVLDVEATVSADRRYVTMTTQPRLASIIQPIRRITQSFLVDVPDIIGDDDDVIDPDEPQQQLISAFIEAPEIEITEIQTTVSVPDKGTLLMGGMRLLGEIEVEAGVPVLSKIPFLNRIFTNRSTVKDERTLLILIKPTIIIQSEQEEQNFPGLLENPAEYDQSSRYVY